LAFRRQTCVRKFEIVGWEDEARKKQYDMFRITPGNNRRWSRTKNLLLQHLQKPLLILHKDLDEYMSDFCNNPHPKKQLRVNAKRFLQSQGNLYNNLFMKHILLKLKCPEWAKPGKYGRTIGDYSVEGSLLTHGLIDFMKEILFTEYLSFSFIIFKCRTPTVQVLRELFVRFYRSDKDLFAFNSDDGILYIVCTDGILRANIDLSSCDISNGVAIFEFLSHWASVDPILSEFVELAIKQCKQTVKVVNPERPKQKLFVKPVQPIEFSGSTLTTILNDIAMLLIALRFSYVKRYRVLSKSQTKQLFLDSAESCGYIVTFDSVAFEGLQFFKYSPVLIDGKVLVCLNLGVILRSLGHTKGDFPGRGPIGLRGLKHSASVVMGLMHTGNTVVLRALIDRFSGFDVSVLKLHHVLDGEAPEDLGYSPFLCRYGATQAEVDELCQSIRSLSVGDVVNSDFIRKVFAIDYGIDT